MHIRRVYSFFLTNKTGAPQGDTLGRINFLSSNSWSCIFNSVGSGIRNRYGSHETRTTPGIRLIVKSMSLLGGRHGISSGNTYGKLCITGMLSSDRDLSLESAYPNCMA